MCFWVVLQSPSTILLSSLKSLGFTDTETEVKEDKQLACCPTTREIEASDAAKHPTIHRTAPTTKIIQCKMPKMPSKIEKPWLI